MTMWSVMVRSKGKRPKLSRAQLMVLELLENRQAVDLVDVVNALDRAFPDPFGPSLRLAQKAIGALRHNGYVHFVSGCDGPKDEWVPLRWDVLNGFLTRGDLVSWVGEQAQWDWNSNHEGPGRVCLAMTVGGGEALRHARSP
jgi:hypothetical protein